MVQPCLYYDYRWILFLDFSPGRTEKELEHIFVFSCQDFSCHFAVKIGV